MEGSTVPYKLLEVLTNILYCYLPVPFQSRLLLFCILHRGELISVGDIENIHKKRKHDKESRLETVIVSTGLDLTCLDLL